MIDESNGDHLDAARDQLMILAMETTPDPIDATSTLFTAGFTILAAAMGPHHAVGAMRNIVETFAARITN